jgi:surfactin synthase thioesterase subunit
LTGQALSIQQSMTQRPLFCIAAIRRSSKDYGVRPEERAQLQKPLTLILARHDEYFNNDKLVRRAEFATNTASHYIDAGHHLLSHPETPEVVRSACSLTA